LTCQPSGNETHKQDDQQTFTRHIHGAASGSDQAFRSARVCANLISF
jgi:hypothetical protein